MDHIPLDSEELIESVSAYSRRLSETIAENEIAVEKWMPANEYMVQLLPLSQEAVTVGSDRWYTTNAAWHSKDEAGRYYEHGFDKEVVSESCGTTPKFAESLCTSRALSMSWFLQVPTC